MLPRATGDLDLEEISFGLRDFRASAKDAAERKQRLQEQARFWRRRVEQTCAALEVVTAVEAAQAELIEVRVPT